MKVISENTITSVTASDEQTAYPATNLLDEHPKIPWKAAPGAAEASISVVANGKTSGMAIYNIVADSVSVEIKDPNNTAWEDGTSWEYGTSWSDAIIPEFSQIFGAESFADTKSLWVEFEDFSSGVTITITFSLLNTATKVIAAGVVVMGEVLSLPNPIYGFNEGLINYSTRRKYSDGTSAEKRRDIVRFFTGAFNFKREDDFYIMLNTARKNSYKPLAWRLTDLPGFRWVVYACHDEMPSGPHQWTEHSVINVKLLEVL